MAAILFITHPEVVIDPKVPVPEWPLSEQGRTRPAPPSACSSSPFDPSGTGSSGASGCRVRANRRSSRLHAYGEDRI